MAQYLVVVANSCSAAVPLEQLRTSVGPDLSVDFEVIVVLERFDRADRLGSENAIHLAQRVAQIVEPRLNAGLGVNGIERADLQLPLLTVDRELRFAGDRGDDLVDEPLLIGAAVYFLAFDVEVVLGVEVGLTTLDTDAEPQLAFGRLDHELVAHTRGHGLHRELAVRVGKT